MFKKIFHKLLFIAPFIGMILSYASGINTIEINKATRYIQSEKHLIKGLSFYSESEENNENLDFFYEESELEDDFELNWPLNDANSSNFISLVTENKKNYHKNYFSFLQKNTPLYDLFCNWKHHLS